MGALVQEEKKVRRGKKIAAEILSCEKHTSLFRNGVSPPETLSPLESGRLGFLFFRLYTELWMQTLRSTSNTFHTFVKALLMKEIALHSIIYDTALEIGSARESSVSVVCWDCL